MDLTFDPDEPNHPLRTWYAPFTCRLGQAKAGKLEE